MQPGAICEPAGAPQQDISCPSCLDFEICRTAHKIPTTSASAANMFSNDCSMAENSCKMLKREPSIKRSVPSMKSLLPLKLLSPTLPQPNIWPSTKPDQRSTFGTEIPQIDQEQPAKVKEKTNNHLGLRLSLLPPRAQHHRDTPIYNEPGSPLPGRAYYTNDDICFNCSPPGSSCDTACIFHDYDHVKKAKDEDEIIDDYDGSQSHTVGRNNFSRQSYATDKSYVTDVPRSSRLSFQCSGENLFPDEGAWLSSPLPNFPRAKAQRQSSTQLPLDRHVESWLSDTSSTAFDDDTLACATILSASRAHMIEVNTSRLSDVSIPPRASSLNSPSYPVHARYSWESSDDSPPETPTGEWEFDDSRSPRKPCRAPQWIFPQRPLDLAMASPPVSPKVFPDPPVASRFSFSVMSAGIEADVDPNLSSRWSFDSAASEPRTDFDIISDLEDIVSGFPSTMLVPDTPCVAAIRLDLANSRSQRPATTPNPPSYVSQRPGHQKNTSHPEERKSVQNFSRHRRMPLTSSRSSPMIQTAAWTKSYISESPAPTANDFPPTLDVEALHRIFPRSSEFTRLALYAHVIAYTFISSLPTPKSVDTSSRRRRDTPYWTNSSIPAKAAAVLAYPRASNILTNTTSSSGLQARIADLKINLRRCIFRLLNNMDSNICHEDATRPIYEDHVSGSGAVMLRAVEEIVRGCEVQAFSRA